MLTNYDGKYIVYDAIGNPLADGTWSYTWEQGRKLTKMQGSAGTWNYTYNSDGMRVSRSNGTDTVTYTYWYDGDGKLLRMKYNDIVMSFSYSASGQPMSITYNGTVYYYLLNAQGDVVGLIDSTGALVVQYTYDAWGRLLSTTYPTDDTTSSLYSALGVNNPLRYRSYIYDSETGLYYLQTRYYNPTIGRFINADQLLITGADSLGFNLFAYCGNCPTNRSDTTGSSWLIGLLVTAFVVKTVCAIIECRRVNKEMASLPEPSKDITDSFGETLETNASIVKDTTSNEGFVESFKQFYHKVRNQGEWDLKQFPEYQGTFQFNGITLQGQDLGNINFGYTGKALGLPDEVLLLGAGYAQVKAGNTTLMSIIVSNGDDLRDQLFIIYGILLYNENH